jgi:hypothetical protein
VAKGYTLSECQHLLVVTNRQLDRLLVSAGIDKQSLADTSNDRRRKVITQEQLNQLLHLHREEVPSADMSLATRVAVLEREMKRLAGIIATSRTPTPRPIAGANDTPPVARRQVEGMISTRGAADLAVAHGANSYNAARGWDIWKQEATRANKTTALQAVRDYLMSHMSGIWSTCGDATCECARL